MNCQSIWGKSKVIEVTVNSAGTDILICTETHIDSSIKNSEILPLQFQSQVSRRDRTGSGGSGSGGTLIAVRDSLLAEPLNDIGNNWENKSEICWMEIMLQRKKSLIT
jgi:hypothetical protein